jgi:ABC-2 type transport system ATP-binding protein
MNSDIIARGLRKEFRSTVALASLDLEVPEGSIYALAGPNGAGKTTLIKTLMNIHRPTAGRSEVLGIDSRRLSGKPFERIGYVSENQECLDWMTVRQFLKYLKPFYPTWDSKFADDMLQRYQLPTDRKIGHLSRGMKMKAQLVSSLAYRPRLIVLDEPFTGLDAMVRDELIEGLLSRAEGSTIFISSHDLNEIESFASHIGYLDQGKLLFSEEMDSLRARFREVIVTFNNPAALPETHPQSWLQPEASGAVIRFIASLYQDQQTENDVRRFFSDIKDIAMNPLSLRSIFVALAKTNRARNI